MNEKGVLSDQINLLKEELMKRNIEKNALRERIVELEAVEQEYKHCESKLKAANVRKGKTNENG